MSSSCAVFCDKNSHWIYWWHVPFRVGQSWSTNALVARKSAPKEWMYVLCLLALFSLRVKIFLQAVSEGCLFKKEITLSLLFSKSYASTAETALFNVVVRYVLSFYIWQRIPHLSSKGFFWQSYPWLNAVSCELSIFYRQLVYLFCHRDLHISDCVKI